MGRPFQNLDNPNRWQGPFPRITGPIKPADGETILRALERVAESFERDIPAYVDQWWFHPLERRVAHLADDLGAPFLEGDQEQRIAGSNCWGRCSEGSIFGLDGPAGLTIAGKQLWVAARPGIAR